MKDNAKKIKAILLIAALLISALLFTGCVYRGYSGEYPELCSVAWSNIPLLKGYTSNGEALYDADVEVLSEDSYGRVLFSYSENYYTPGSDILIMQYTEDGFAYYYPDECYVSLTFESFDEKPDLNSDLIMALKAANDWEKPIDRSKCEGTEIITNKREGEKNPGKSVFEGIVREYHESSGRFIHPKNTSFVNYYDFFVSDDYGRKIYVVYTDFFEFTEKTEISYSYVFLVLLNPDGSYKPSTVTLLEDRLNPQNAVKAIKAENGWNTPLG